MSTKHELEKQLDKIPIDAPYQVVANIREAHNELHTAGKLNESVPYSITSAEELADRLRENPETHLGKARKLIKETTRAASTGSSVWARPALRTLVEIYRDHIPPEDINHKY